MESIRNRVNRRLEHIPKLGNVEHLIEMTQRIGRQANEAIEDSYTQSMRMAEHNETIANSKTKPFYYGVITDEVSNEEGDPDHIGVSGGPERMLNEGHEGGVYRIGPDLCASVRLLHPPDVMMSQGKAIAGQDQKWRKLERLHGVPLSLKDGEKAPKMGDLVKVILNNMDENSWWDNPTALTAEIANVSTPANDIIANVPVSEDPLGAVTPDGNSKKIEQQLLHEAKAEGDPVNVDTYPGWIHNRGLVAYLHHNNQQSVNLTAGDRLKETIRLRQGVVITDKGLTAMIGNKNSITLNPNGEVDIKGRFKQPPKVSKPMMLTGISIKNPLEGFVPKGSIYFPRFEWLPDVPKIAGIVRLMIGVGKAIHTASTYFSELGNTTTYDEREELKVKVQLDFAREQGQREKQRTETHGGYINHYERPQQPSEHDRVDLGQPEQHRVNLGQQEGINI